MKNQVIREKYQVRDLEPRPTLKVSPEFMKAEEKSATFCAALPLQKPLTSHNQMRIITLDPIMVKDTSTYKGLNTQTLSGLRHRYQSRSFSWATLQDTQASASVSFCPLQKCCFCVAQPCGPNFNTIIGAKRARREAKPFTWPCSREIPEGSRQNVNTGGNLVLATRKHSNIGNNAGLLEDQCGVNISDLWVHHQFVGQIGGHLWTFAQSPTLDCKDNKAQIKI